MSDQNKEQAIGYILKATMDEGINTSGLKNLFKVLDNAINDHIKANELQEVEQPFDNYSTHDFMAFILREIGIDDTRIKQIGSYLYGAFDSYTVEEAEEFYQAFKTILRIR